MKNTRNLKKTVEVGFAMTTIAVLLAACGGGGGGSSGFAPTSTGTGFVTKGPVVNAAVWLDMDDSRTKTAADVQCGTTIADGSFVCTYLAPLTAANNTHLLIAVGGTDTFTNKAIDVNSPMLAPPGATQVSPLTNLVALQAASGVPVGTPIPAANITTANTAVVHSLGLPAGTTLATTNSMNVPAVLAAETAVASAVDQIVAAIAGATGAALSTLSVAYNAAMAAISTSMAGATAPVSTTTLVSSAMTAAVSQVPAVTSIQAANLAQLDASIAATAYSIEAATGSASEVQAAALIGATTAAQIQTQVAASSVAFAAPMTASQVAAITTSIQSAVVALSPTLNNVLPVAGSTVNGAAVTNGVVTVVGPITTAVLNFGTAVGTPVYGPVTLTFDVRSTVLGDNRIFSGTISGLTVPAGGGALSTAAASASIFGQHTSGATATAVANATAVATFVAGTIGTSGNITLNVGTILTTVSAAAGFSGLNLLKGNFNVVLTVNGVPLANQTDTLPMTSSTINVQVN